MLQRNATASPCVLKDELISATSDTPSRSAVCDRTLLTLSDMLLRQFDLFLFEQFVRKLLPFGLDDRLHGYWHVRAHCCNYNIAHVQNLLSFEESRRFILTKLN